MLINYDLKCHTKIYDYYYNILLIYHHNQVEKNEYDMIFVSCFLFDWEKKTHNCKIHHFF